jgi:predicted enzyme related to lactoylglutathione lyase
METSRPQPNAVGWFEIYVNDMKRAKAFYETVFQHPIEALPQPTGSDMQMLTFPMNSAGTGASGALVKSPQMKPGAGGTLVYFSCVDCAIEAARASAQGGLVCQPKMSIAPYGFIAIVQDTEGNTIGLHSMT